MSKNDHHRKKRETLRHRRQRKKMLHGLKLRPYHFRSHKTYNAVSLKDYGIILWHKPHYLFQRVVEF